MAVDMYACLSMMALHSSGLLQETLASIVWNNAGVVLQMPLPLRLRTTGPLLALLVAALPPRVDCIY